MIKNIIFAVIVTLTIGFAVSTTELPASLPNQLLVAEVTVKGTPVIIARSYHAHPWEVLPVLGQRPGLRCNRTESGYNCTLNSTTPFKVREIPLPTEILQYTGDELAARLLQQATFGASKAEIAHFTKTYGTNYGQWIRDQFKVTPTGARSYYRSRVNPRPLENFLVTREIGQETDVCDLDTRWHQYVFELRDKNKDLVVRTDEVANHFTLRINGQLRGEVSTFLGQPFPGTKITGVTFPATLRICAVDEKLGGRIGLSTDKGVTCRLSYPNPPINITLAGSPVQLIGDNDAKFVPVLGNRGGAFILKSRSVKCANRVDAFGNSFIRHANQTYRFDKRIKFILNTLDNPAAVPDSDAGEAQCPIVTESYLNRNNCVRRSACGAVASFKSAPVPLNDTIIRAMFTLNNRYVYVIKGLRLEAPFDISPCTSVTSRWMKIETTPCTNPTDIDVTTRNTIAKALNASTDPNPYVRDITLVGPGCTASPTTIGAQITAAGVCWQHVHPDLLSVRDATLWTQIHDGNAQAKASGNPNPIMKWANGNLTYINFPSWHLMQRWYDRRQNLPVIGRYGDVIDFQTLNTDLQSEKFAALVGALRSLPDGAEAPEACGSPGEVSNVPELGNHYIAYVNMSNGEQVEQLEYMIPSQEDLTYVLYNIHLFSKDQLRQRVAWALSNIVVAAPTDLGLRDYPEGWLSFYDIFIRSATGNYLNILRDVSFHPIMGLYLTYSRSRAFAVSRSFPDENYAREIMQLFSVGLWRLNDDGSQRLDANGKPIATYTNDDILDYARIWTGFDLVPSRINVGDSTNGKSNTMNLVDPMIIRPAGHDRFPKAKLDSGHVGDGYPLCDDLPPQSFLRAGARFEFTGDLSVEGDALDQEAPSGAGLRGRFTPTPGKSALWKLLCAPQANGRCAFPESVTLTTNLACEGAQECNAGRVRVVKVVDPVARKKKFYSYVQLPCVRLTFFDGGRTVRRNAGRAQCADPATAVGSPVCCNASDVTRSVNRHGSECLFAAEATDFATAQARCSKLGLTVCSDKLRDRSIFNNTCAEDMFMWTNGSCSVQIQVYPSGEVGIVDPISPFFLFSKSSLNNVFRPRWNGNNFPIGKGGVCNASCTYQSTPEGPTCICNITVHSNPIFPKMTSLSTFNGTFAVAYIQARAFIGAPKPSSFDAGTYTRCDTEECKNLTGVTVWLHKSDQNGLLSEKTIFELPAYRRGRADRFLFNRLSMVRVANSFSFRNPPHFAPLLGEQLDVTKDYLSDNLWVRQAENEVEAFLVHLFEHSNTAPFICYRLIQQLVTSNPSPRYVNAVVNAFRWGAYGSVQFSNQYGDLAAAVYAIFMDREARSILLEADPTFGMLRDPLIKLYHIMRALEYKSPINREVAMNSLISSIGVQPLRQPSVFSFYLPEFQPAGPVTSAGLVSPQAQITTSPNLIGFLNGATSLIDNGLTSCYSGFGVSQSRSACAPDGTLQYTPAAGATSAQIVDELDLLLTARRLNTTNRKYLVQQYDATLKTTNSTSIALKTVIKLLVSSPEFHTTNLNVPKRAKRQPPATVASSGRRFKAIVVIWEAGGCDSWNKVVPHSECKAKDLYKEYQMVRTGAAIDKNILLPVSVPAGSQPCDKFGIHPAMPKQRDLYNQKELAFLTNIGALVEPTTKAAMNAKTVNLPPSLFAHNIMQRSIQNVHAQNVNAQGVLGRIIETLTQDATPYKSSLFSFSGPVKMVQGKVPPNLISANGGVPRFTQFKTLNNALSNLTQFISSSVFAETYADVLSNSLRNSEYLGGLLQTATLKTNFTKSGFNQEMQMTAKLIKALSKQTDTERATFFVSRGGYDTHATFNLSPMYGDIDSGLGSFADEMKAQGLWDDVVVVSISDFARTLYANGAGTDHAWGGQHIVAGGKVRGGQILGPYPETLTDESSLSLGRGRLIPTLPFESVWNGIAEWFGVPQDKLSYVVPNAGNFNASAIFTKDELFRP